MESVSVDGDGDVGPFTIDPLNGRDKFMTGEATGVFHEGSSLSYQYCDGGPSVDTQSLEGVSFRIHMDGVGDVYRQSNSDSFHA